MLISGDIGGAKTDCAVYSKTTGPHALVSEAEVHSVKGPSLQAMVTEFLSRVRMSVDRTSSDVAGPIELSCRCAETGGKRRLALSGVWNRDGQANVKSRAAPLGADRPQASTMGLDN